MDQMDDHENRDRRQNICIRGLPEVKRAPDLLLTVIGLFCQILGVSKPDTNEIDRVHSALFYVPQNADRPRDVICKLHRYSVKEAITKAVRNRSTVEFDGTQISLFTDLTYRTLMQRQTVRPLLEALRAIDVKYRWGFPFCIMAAQNGKTAVLRTKDDLQHFFRNTGLALRGFSRLESEQPQTSYTTS